MGAGVVVVAVADEGITKDEVLPRILLAASRADVLGTGMADLNPHG
jgi:hypothetical protein